MQYQGGKAFVGKAIAEYLNPQIHDKIYYEPFCGGLGVAQHVKANTLYLSDNNEALITMYHAMVNGWIPPDIVSEITYKAIKLIQDPLDPMTAFVGIGCSWGAKWFGGYARNNKGDNYAKRSAKSLESKRSLLRKFNDLNSGSNFRCVDYRDLRPVDAIVYCDPPYAGLTKFAVSKNNFNHDEFWQIMREWSKNNVVIISHYDAPADFKCVKEMKTICGIKRKDNKVWDGKVERLFRMKD